MHFGLHLKNKGVITAEQLVNALETQLNTLVPIGQLALEEGIISPREIFDVLRAQREAPSVRFGELAIEMDLMTRDELMRLLMLQSDRKRAVADILVLHGTLTPSQANAEKAEFRQVMASHKAGSVVRSKIVPAPRGVVASSRDANTMAAV